MSVGGAVIGVVCAVTAIAIERKRRAKAGLATDARSVAGFERGAWRPGSIERVLLTDAAALSFAIGVAALVVYGIAGGIADWPNPSTPVMCSVAGAVFGMSCALLGRRRQWT
jgi:hypothetical protein